MELKNQITATNESWERFQFHINRDWGLIGTDTGIHDLNLMIGGWIPCKVTTIGARSGIGKTALTTEMFKAAGRVEGNRRTEFLFFTWELSPSYLVDRSICNEVGITNRMLLQGSKLLSKEKIREIEIAYKNAKSLPVTYQNASINIKEIEVIVNKWVDKIREKEKKEGLIIQPVVVIDYIGMAKFEGSGLRTYGIGDFMNGAKRIANKTECSWCIFAQINRGADDKEMPQRSDFADSASIENASDNLILLHRPEYNNIPIIHNPSEKDQDGSLIPIDSTDKMLIRVLKGRDFGTGDKLINCRVKYFRFWSLHDQYNFDYWHQYSDEQFWLKTLNLST